MTKGEKQHFKNEWKLHLIVFHMGIIMRKQQKKFSVSYQQARNYTVKYENSGVDALQDNRGRRKPEDALTEIENFELN